MACSNSDLVGHDNQWFRGSIRTSFFVKLPPKESDVAMSSKEDEQKQKINDEFGNLALSFKQEKHLYFIKDARTDDSGLQDLRAKLRRTPKTNSHLAMYRRRQIRGRN